MDTKITNALTGEYLAAELTRVVGRWVHCSAVEPSRDDLTALSHALTNVVGAFENLITKRHDSAAAGRHYLNMLNVFRDVEARPMSRGKDSAKK